MTMTFDPADLSARYPGMNADSALVDLGARLRRALVAGDAEAVARCMVSEAAFGLHQGRTRTGYVTYEVDEFMAKAARFGLNAEGYTAVVPWTHGRTVSFMFVNDDGWMLFENAFQVHHTDQGPLLAGNGCAASWQSKLRRTRIIDGDQVVQEHRGRAINVKPVGGTVDGLVVLDPRVVNARQTRFDHEALYGGSFVTCQFDYEDDDEKTGWTRARVVGTDPGGRRTFRTLEGDLRGEDHPFFVQDQFPRVERPAGQIWLVFSPNSKPAEVMAHGPGFRQQWKYPDDAAVRLDGVPQEVVVSDHIGHDWSLRWGDDELVRSCHAL